MRARPKNVSLSLSVGRLLTLVAALLHQVSRFVNSLVSNIVIQNFRFQKELHLEPRGFGLPELHQLLSSHNLYPQFKVYIVKVQYSTIVELTYLFHLVLIFCCTGLTNKMIDLKFIHVFITSRIYYVNVVCCALIPYSLCQM